MSDQFMVTNNEIKVNEVINRVIHPEAGAINTFIGTVREWTGDKRTLYLEYEAYVPMAEKSCTRSVRRSNRDGRKRRYPSSIGLDVLKLQI